MFGKANTNRLFISISKKVPRKSIKKPCHIRKMACIGYLTDTSHYFFLIATVLKSYQP